MSKEKTLWIATCDVNGIWTVRASYDGIDALQPIAVMPHIGKLARAKAFKNATMIADALNAVQS